MHSITLYFRQYQPESVYVLPKTSKARIVEIYSPEEYKKMPKKMQWEELRRYWRRVYGYLLSPNPEPCVDIEFYRGMKDRAILVQVLSGRSGVPKIDGLL